MVRTSKQRVLEHVPVVVGLLVAVLTLPVILFRLQDAQELRKQAAERSYTIPQGTAYQQGTVIVKYRPAVEIKTTSTINQHRDAFDCSDIAAGLPGQSLSNLDAIGCRRIERIFKSAKLPQERTVTERLLGVVGVGPKPDRMANYMVVQIPTTVTVQTAINVLLKDPNVESVQPNFLYHLASTPNDTYFTQQWNMTKIAAPDAWNITQGSASVTVAVIDSGVDTSHPDLQGELVTGINTIDNTTNTQDNFGHGTHVAGIIGAIGNNGTGVAGVNWRVKIMPIKVADSASTGQVPETRFADAIRYAADHGAKVANLSFALTTSGGSAPPLTAEAVSYAISKGVVIVAAADNQHTDASHTYPAALPGVIAVSATDQNDNLASFSNFGSIISVAAPGVGILSTMAANASTQQTTSCQDSSKRYCVGQGTSMAAPHVSGLAALILAKNPSLSGEQVKNIITATADDLPPPGRDNNFGFGRINAKKAIEAAGSNPTASPNVSGNVTPTIPPNQPVIAGIANTISLACGNQAILAKSVDGANQNRTWLSYVAGFGGLPFSPQGALFVYVPQNCKPDVGGQSISLNQGWNNVTLSASASAASASFNSSITNIAPTKKALLERLLLR